MPSPASRRVPTPRDYTGSLDAIARLVAELEAENTVVTWMSAGRPMTSIPSK